MPPTGRAPPALDCLPAELIQHVLSYLADPRTLLSTILTCTTIYSAFLGAEADLTSRVVTNCVDEQTSWEAFAALESSRWAPMDLEKMQRFAQEWLVPGRRSTRRWTLKEALELYHLHTRVEYFANDFLIKAFSANVPEAAPGPDAQPISLQELIRVRRAFYRYGIYCNMFHEQQENPIDWVEKQPTFFGKFSGFENEQLACVHDYMYKKAFQVFDEFAAHDVAWGASQIRPGVGFNCGFVQFMLARGLMRLYDACTSKSYEGRHQALYQADPTNLEYESLSHGLVHANNFYGGLLTPEYYDNILGAVVVQYKPFVPEDDSGPVDAWRWAHQDNPTVHRLFAPSNQTLREQGYVFWDRARLEAWPRFHQIWEGRTPDNLVADSQPPRGEAIFAARRLSRRRLKIYEAGGRGWWSPTDETKVVYPVGVNPPRMILSGVSYMSKTEQRRANSSDDNNNNNENNNNNDGDENAVATDVEDGVDAGTRSSSSSSSGSGSSASSSSSTTGNRSVSPTLHRPRSWHSYTPE